MKKSTHPIKITNILMLKSMLVIVFLYSYIDIANVSMQMFNKMNVGDNQNQIYTLSVDTSVDFYGESHKNWCYFLAIPSMLIFGFGLPLFAFIHLIYLRKHNMLKKTKYRYIYGFLFIAYSDKLSNILTYILYIRSIMIAIFFFFKVSFHNL